SHYPYLTLLVVGRSALAESCGDSAGARSAFSIMRNPSQEPLSPEQRNGGEEGNRIDDGIYQGRRKAGWDDTGGQGCAHHGRSERYRPRDRAGAGGGRRTGGGPGPFARMR